MTQAMILDVIRNAFLTILKTSGPILLIALVVGLLISILQATTQIQEQTLSFVPKLVAVMFALIILGSYMMNVLVDFASSLFKLIAMIN